MNFYSSIAKAYDQIFPLNPLQVEFVESCFRRSVAGKRFVDAGCGTGSLAILLARRSANVFGFDSDTGMIDIAHEKQPQALNLRFKTGDLVDELSELEKGRYDGILCFGNTIVHLNKKDRIISFAQKASGLLKQGGKLLLQTVNYNRVLKENIDSLPTIETNDYRFVRKYNLRNDGLIDFETELTEKSTGKKIVNSVKLLPLKKDEIEDILNPFFSEVSYFGSFKKEPWHEGSYHLVVEAEK